MKNYFFKKSINNHPNRYFEKSKGVNHGNKVLIIGDYSDLDDLEQCKSYLKKRGRHVKFLLFSEQKVAERNDIYTSAELNWYGVPKNVENVDKKLAEHFDLCIFMAKHHEKHYVFLLELIRSEFTIGPDIEGLKTYFDLILSHPQESTEDFFKYLTKNINNISI